MRKSLVIAAACLSILAAQAQEYFVKEVTFKKGASLEEKIDMASRLVPSEKQMAWQQLELTAFLHFGMNTFTNREWGDGTESPQLFNPKLLDAEQWVKTLKDSGFNLVILTCKHHDGFCLWPTATTGHCVRNSPWRNGKGDVLGDLRKACDKYGMKLGVYLSPWDRNAQCYGSDEYNDFFVAQLTELLSNYGKIDEVWFDGACGEGPNGKKQVYDWKRYYEVIHRLQPGAVSAIMGEDVRWVGNEAGQGRTTEWSTTAFMPAVLEGAKEYNATLGLEEMSKDLGGRDILAKADKLFWWPAEVDVSIRPGWFWHKSEQPKPLSHLTRIYLNSVGRNAVLLLNIPPNTDGLIDDADCVRLAELHRWVDENFSKNLLPKRAHYGAYCLSEPTTINCVELQEDITRGQRIEKFHVLAYVDREWKLVTEGTTVGKRRILTFPAVKAEAVIAVIDQSRAKANLQAVKAYNLSTPVDVAYVDPVYTRLATEGWTATASAETPHHEAANVLDGSPNTYWLASQEGAYITIDMKQRQKIAGFAYQPRPADSLDGTIFKYAFLVSNDGKRWTECPTTGEFGNIKNNPIEQVVYLNKPVTARFFRLVSKQEVNGNACASASQLNILVKRK